MIEIHPLTGVGEVVPGTDLGVLLASALTTVVAAPAPGDVLVVTQKIVSKAEGRFVDLREVDPGAEVCRLAAVVGKDPRFIELVLRESSAVVRAVRHVLITRHRSGRVMANAGIDRSNLGFGADDHVLLLPLDADQSATRLRAALASRWPTPPAVVISDSFGRPWRLGVVNVALGASGLPALDDRRGKPDRDGRPPRRPDLGEDEFLDLFELWCERYIARLMAGRASTRDRLAELWQERHNLFAARNLTPPDPARQSFARLG